MKEILLMEDLKEKHIFPNGNYYIGQFRHSMQNGKGILYYKNEK